MKKVILVILDAMTRAGAKNNMGYLWHLTEIGKAHYINIKGGLPSVSRPCYETICTGMYAAGHGITSNNVIRSSKEENIFSLARKNGLKTAAAAYFWFSELYNASPFDPMADRFVNNGSKNIQHGIFYCDDSYPDSHLFLDADYLQRTYHPDLLLVHPMGIDYTGHAFGSSSREYEKKTGDMDAVLAQMVPRWIEADYGILVTSDHGMSELGSHGGNREILRDVFLYAINVGKAAEQKEYSQLSIAPTICKLMGIKPSDTMLAEPILFK